MQRKLAKRMYKVVACLTETCFACLALDLRISNLAPVAAMLCL